MEAERISILFRELCGVEVEDDGLGFPPESVRVKLIRQENVFGGIRVTLTALLENARIPLQVDIGFGDETVPIPEVVNLPTILSGFPAPLLMVYQKETTIAEKLHAIVTLERANSRMKDFFDLYVLSQEFSFTSARVTAAVRDTFARRATAIPAGIPDGLTQNFATDSAKIVQWKAFLRQNVSPPRDVLALSEVVDQIAAFLLPVLVNSRGDSSAEGTTAVWDPCSGWH